jgi:biotin carboxylase
LLAVVYDLGAAGATEILASARTTCDVVFVGDRSNPYFADRAAELAEYAQVCDITGLDQDTAVARVAALGPAGIVTFSEAQLERTARLALGCGLPFHTLDTVRLLTDKYLQRVALRRAGIDATRSRTVVSVAEIEHALAEVGLPAVIKPRRGGAASRDTYRIDRIEDLAHSPWLTPTEDGWVLEELLVGENGRGPVWGDHVSVELLSLDGVVHPVNITGKFALAEPFRETGQFSPARLDGDLSTRVFALAVNAVQALGIRHGASHTEIKLTAQGPRLIEVNGRLGGNLGDLLRRSNGLDIVRATLEVALGRVPRLSGTRPTKLAYQRYLAPPQRVATLLELRGLDRIAALPGVGRVEPHADLGRLVDWRRGTEECLAVVYGQAPDHEALQTSVQAIDADFDPLFA